MPQTCKTKSFLYFSFMILVTGGTGLIGAHLLYFLVLENDTIRATCRPSSDLATVERVFAYYSTDYHTLFQKIEWFEADITDIHALDKAFEGVTEVYHSAALISFDPSDYHLMRTINIEGTANIVNFCIANKIRKLCYVSSVAAIGKKGNNAVNTEETEWLIENNNYGYAITKYGAEMEVWRASQEGIPVVIVNPGVVLGPGYWHQGSGQLFGKVNKGLRFYSEGITGYVGVIDVVKIMLRLMNETIENERFILVSEHKSYREVFNLIAQHLNKKPPSVKVTPFLAELIWRLEKVKYLITRKAPLLTKNSAKSLTRNKYYSSEKLHARLNYQYEPIEEVIAQTCAIYVKEMDKEN